MENKTESIETKKPKNVIGGKYYRYRDGFIEVFRVIKIKNDNCYIVKYDPGYEIKNLKLKNTITKMTKADIDAAIKLRPDGVFTIAKVKNGIMDDVFISLNTPDRGTTPYCVCRQNVKDLFEVMMTGDLNNSSVGLCISQDTVPSNVNYNDMLQATEVLASTVIEVYMDDTLNSIMKLIYNIKKYDDTLFKIYSEASTHARKFRYHMPQGYCLSVRELLVNNEFMRDFDKAFNIITLSEYTITSLKKYIGDTKIPEDVLARIEQATGREINSQYYLMPFTKEIILSDVKTEYNLIRDFNDDIYLLTYLNRS